MAEGLGYATHGDGPARVLVLHEWMGDHRTYDPVRPYLDGATWGFADLRGYGASRHLEGRYDLDEAVADVAALADALGWERFHLVGHSMSTVVAQHLALRSPDRIEALALITPVSPRGMGAPDDVVAWLEQVGGDEAAREGALGARFAERYAAAWGRFKLRRWAESARPDAVRGYVRLFAGTHGVGAMPDVPVTVILGEHDHEPFREATVREGLAGWRRLEVTVCRGAGHYPMQEAPVALASALCRFVEPG